MFCMIESQLFKHRTMSGKVKVTYNLTGQVHRLGVK